ncbi:MAG: dihydrodipicolinate synthase family protein [Chthoniobacterales bacterium]
MTTQELRSLIFKGLAIPAQPLALDADRKLSEKHQKAITRYYFDAGTGGLAVGVHSTQFEIREPQHGLFKPVLELASQTLDAELEKTPRPFIKISGVCGPTPQAIQEAEFAKSTGYHAGLLSLAALRDSSEDQLLEHCREVASVFPIIGFYLQPAVGGRVLPFSFWRKFAEIPNVLAIKIAPFNRYQTIDVVRAVIEAGRDDIALYTGNDDSIVTDLLTNWKFPYTGEIKSRRIEGGLLGHWGVWTKKSVELLEEIKVAREKSTLDAKWLETATAVTDMNAALFDAANRFRGCIPGILEVLRRQGLTLNNHCLNPDEVLSPGQAEELDRVCAAYPELTDDGFVKENLDRWLS